MRSYLLRLRVAIAAFALIASDMGVVAEAQTAAPQPSAPMAKPPAAPPGAASATNPDNMPVKKPTKPTNDRLMRSDPASDAKAK